MSDLVLANSTLPDRHMDVDGPVKIDADSYLTNCVYMMDRNADYKAGELAVAAFEPTDEPISGNGNVKMYMAFDVRTKLPLFTKEPVYRNPEWVSIHRAIPSALLMYRLAALFEGTIHTAGPEGYKVVWHFGLRHKASGKYLWFGEWKGAAQFWTTFMDYEDLPDDYRRDLLRLLAVLVSDTCPHPYDGLVCGSVA